jgi:hypothetical protein
VTTLVAAFLIAAFAARASAHCDRLDGPVVTAARAALAAGNVDLVLAWVPEKDEREVREVFAAAMTVRRLGAAAQQLADRHVFETVVRVHRAGEGAPYTGLQPAGLDPGPAIAAADTAVSGGALEPLAKLLGDEVSRGLSERFAHVRHTKGHPPGDVKAGREHVKAYVEFLHYVEGVYEAARRTAHGHAEAAGAATVPAGPARSSRGGQHP